MCMMGIYWAIVFRSATVTLLTCPCERSHDSVYGWRGKTVSCRQSLIRRRVANLFTVSDRRPNIRTPAKFNRDFTFILDLFPPPVVTTIINVDIDIACNSYII